MISLLPGTTAADANGAFAVMALIADKDACTKRVVELAEAALAFENRRAAAEAAEKKAGAEIDTAIDKNGELLAAKGQFDATRAAWAQMSVERDAQARILADKLAAKEADLVQREQTVAANLELLARREAAVIARSDSLATDQAAAAALRAELEDRLAKIAAAAGR